MFTGSTKLHILLSPWFGWVISSAVLDHLVVHEVGSCFALTRMVYLEYGLHHKPRFPYIEVLTAITRLITIEFIIVSDTITCSDGIIIVVKAVVLLSSVFIVTIALL